MSWYERGLWPVGDLYGWEVVGPGMALTAFFVKQGDCEEWTGAISGGVVTFLFRDGQLSELPELEDGEVDGWAVFTGAEGETPRFVAFFTDEEDATEYAKKRAAEDSTPELAVLTADYGIVAAPDTDLGEHAHLRARIDQARAAGLTL